MPRKIEAIVEKDGSLRLLEDVELCTPIFAEPQADTLRVRAEELSAPVEIIKDR